MRKKLLLVTVAALCLLVSAFVSLPSPEQKPSRETEVPTSVQEGVLTPRQKEHSKLYETYKGQGKIRDLILKRDALTVTVHPSLPHLSPGGRQTNTITELAEKADAIVIGRITGKSSQITSNGTFVFTDYPLVIEEVLKANNADTLQLNSTITVTRPGGKVLLNGHVVTFNVESFKPLIAGRRYTLFLKFVPSTGAYQAVNEKASFDISDSKVETLTDAPDAQEDFEKDLGSFISSVKLAIAHSRRNGGAR